MTLATSGIQQINLSQVMLPSGNLASLATTGVSVFTFSDVDDTTTATITATDISTAGAGVVSSTEVNTAGAGEIDTREVA